MSAVRVLTDSAVLEELDVARRDVAHDLRSGAAFAAWLDARRVRAALREAKRRGLEVPS